MIKNIRKFSPEGAITLPSSKSYSHRFLIGSFLLKKSFEIFNINFCDDVQASIECLKNLGARYEINNNNIKLISIEKPITNNSVLNCQSSASTLRMILPLAIEILGEVNIVCSDLLKARGIKGFDQIFETNKIIVNDTDKGFHIAGKFNSYNFYCSDLSSSQYISGLLFLIAFKKKGSIHFSSDIESKDYILMTLNVLEQLGYCFEKGENCIRFKSINELKISEAIIESDASSLAPFAVFGCLGGKITVNNISSDSLQPDYKIINLLESIGAKIEKNNNCLTFYKSNLKPFEFDISNCIDLGPILFVLAAMIDGESLILGTHRLREKESNRILSMKKAFEALNIDLNEGENYVSIKGKKYIKCTSEFDCCNDHRIAFALSILGACSEGWLQLKGCECVSKSFNNFYEIFDSLRKPLITVSIYSLNDLEKLKEEINCAILNTKFSCIYDSDFDLDTALKICFENGIEPIISINKIFMENEISEVSLFIDRYSSCKFLISDLGVAQILEEKGLINNAIYYPDTLICNEKDLDIYQSFNFDATSMSNEITIKDLTDSYLHTNANIFYQVFGRKIMFYSKRKLLNLYMKHKGIQFDKTNIFLREKIRNNCEIPTYENDNGFYCFRPYNISLLKEAKNLKFIKYMYFESLNLDATALANEINIFKNVLSGTLSVDEGLEAEKKLGLNIEDGFSYNDTVYIKEKVHL